MKNHKKGETVMFFTLKGSVKIGIINEINSVLNQDEYEDVYSIEVENGKIYFVDPNHILDKTF